MAIQYTLKINQIDCLPQADGKENVVFRVYWAYTGTEEGKSGAVGGVTDLTYSGGPFTPYSELTKEQVSGWVLDAWDPKQKQSYEESIAAQMTLKTEPLPWGEAPVGPTP